MKYFGKFREARPSAVKPAGFIREFLLRQQSGLSSHYDRQGFPFNTPMWEGGVGTLLIRDCLAHDAETVMTPHQESFAAWTPYEQTAYLLDGLVRLGILLDDKEMVEKFRRNLEFVLAHPQENGRLGHFATDGNTEWPFAVFFRAIAAYYETTGDKNIPGALKKHFDSQSAASLGENFRHIANIEGLLKLYEWSGDEELISKACAAYEAFNEYSRIHYEKLDELPLAKLASMHNFVMHGVSFAEESKLPVLLYLYTGDRKMLELAEEGLRDVLERHEQICGIVSSNEFLSGRDPLQGYETCVITDFTWTLGYYLQATGDASYADRIEKIIYNALPGAITKDFHQLQYLSVPNQVIATESSTHSQMFRGFSPMQQYRPDHFPQCCPGNVHRAMPNFALRLWMLDAGNAPVAALYGASEFSGEYSGKKYSFTEETEYPFDETLRFIFHTGEKDGINMPFTFRVPGWCAGAVLRLNSRSTGLDLTPGQYHTLERTWQNGDTLELVLPMQPIQKLDRYWSYFECGPLVYSYAIPAQITPDGDEFSPLAIEPAGEWNYSVKPGSAVELCRRKSSGYPLEEPPVSLKIKARRITGFDALDEGRYTPEIPLFGRTYGEETELELHPYGSTLLRLTAFPDGVKRKVVPVYQALSMGPYPYDFRKDLSEQSFLPEMIGEEEFRRSAAKMQAGINGFFDLQNQYGKGDGKLAYIMFYIWADKDCQATLAIGASDGAQCFMNGRMFYEIEHADAAQLHAPYLVEHELKAGWNHLLLKVVEDPALYQYRRAWGAKVEAFITQDNA